MNSTATSADETTRYLDGVRAALADLPAADRDALLEDLPGHLAEVAGEAPGELMERLGPPERYAAELRAAAGMVPGPVNGGTQSGETGMAALVAAARQADRLAGRLLGYPRGRDLLPPLRPGWWVARALVLIVVLFQWHWLSQYRSFGLLAAALVTLALVMVSVRLGRWSVGRGGATRVVLVLVNALVVLAGLQAVHLAWGSWGASASADAVYQSPTVTVYGPDGRIVPGLTVVDQYGNIIGQESEPSGCLVTSVPGRAVVYQIGPCPPETRPPGTTPQTPDESATGAAPGDGSAPGGPGPTGPPSPGPS